MRVNQTACVVDVRGSDGGSSSGGGGGDGTAARLTQACGGASDPIQLDCTQNQMCPSDCTLIGSIETI